MKKTDKAPKRQPNPGHNPEPRTERGRRRRQSKYPSGIPFGHSAWSAGGFHCQSEPKNDNDNRDEDKKGGERAAEI